VLIPDPEPGLFKDVESAIELQKDRTDYARILSQMKRAGAKVCSSGTRALGTPAQ